MGNSKQSVHFEARKGFTTAQSNEHFRAWTEKGWNSATDLTRIDRSRLHLNFEVGKGGSIGPMQSSVSIPQRIKTMLDARGIPDPNEGLEEPRYRTVVDFIITGSHDQLCKLAFGEQEIDYSYGTKNENNSDDAKTLNSNVIRKPEIEQWAVDMYNVLARRYGEENIISFVVHLDETTPHIHANLLPITDDGKLSFKKVFCGADKYEYRLRTLALHDEFAKVNEKWGLDRGDSIEKTHAKYRPTEQYRRELSSECSTLEKEVSDKIATLNDLYQDIRLAERRIKGLQTMIQNLEASRDVVVQEIEDVHNRLMASEQDPGSQQTLARKEESLQRKLEIILEKLEDKRSKLDEADNMLAELQERLVIDQSRHDDMLAQIDSVKGDFVKSYGGPVGSEALWCVLNDFNRVKASMTPEQAELFEGTFLQEMAQKGTKIVVCAAFLAAGMVDDATTFAEKSGGGGTSCDNNWGRDPNEDDFKWFRRCLAQSRKMMRSSGRGVRR